MERRVLVILPHPDDESFGISGSLAWHLKNGTPVTYVCLTLGEMGRNMGKPLFASRVTLPSIRQKELEASCRAIGIHDLRLWGYLDKTIEFEDQERLERRILDIIEELDPSLVVTFYPGYSVHPDHDACGAAVVSAIGKLPAGKRPVVHTVAFSKGCEEVLGPPDVWRDVSEFIPHKIGSISAHRSQFHQFITQVAGDKPEENEEVRNRLGKERFWTYKFD